MCDFRRNYGSVGATARLEQRWVRYMITSAQETENCLKLRYVFIGL